MKNRLIALVAMLSVLAPGSAMSAPAKHPSGSATGISSTRYTGTMNHNQYDYIYVTLYVGTTYRFGGVCDSYCHDLDLRLYNSQGTLITSDTGPDDVPVVYVTARSTQQYRLRVDMVNCNDDPCNWAVDLTW